LESRRKKYKKTKRKIGKKKKRKKIRETLRENFCKEPKRSRLANTFLFNYLPTSYKFSRFLTEMTNTNKICKFRNIFATKKKIQRLKPKIREHTWTKIIFKPTLFTVAYIGKANNTKIKKFTIHFSETRINQSIFILCQL
jgi:hypothetical protein